MSKSALFERLESVGDLINSIMEEYDAEAKEQEATIVYGVVMKNGDGGTAYFGRTLSILEFLNYIANEVIENFDDEELS